MKFVFNINNRRFILDADGADAIVSVLARAEQIDSKWLGAGKGSVDILARQPMSGFMMLSPLPEDEYNMLKLVTDSQS
jgi:hypothetical protein